MNEITTIVILGIYTLIYVIVFILQRNQIQKQSQIISSMESFIKIFDVDQVRKFVDMKHEMTMLTVDKVIIDKGIEFTEKTIRPAVMKEIEKVKDDVSQRFDEFANSAIDLIMLLPKEMQTDYIETAFPLNKQVLLDVMKEINNAQLKKESNSNKLDNSKII